MPVAAYHRWTYNRQNGRCSATLDEPSDTTGSTPVRNVVEFFNPRPIIGVFVDGLAGCDWQCPGTEDAESAELQDVNLLPSGHLVLTLLLRGADEPTEWIGLNGVLDATDGSMALELGGTRYLAFPPRERERVSALFLKLANRQY